MHIIRAFRKITETKMGTAMFALPVVVLIIALSALLYTSSAAHISDCDIALTKDSFTYTGAEITPGVTITDGGKTLILDEDYALKYENNTEPGEGKITIAGLGSYIGFTRKTFPIVVDPVKNLDAVYVNGDRAKDSPFINVSWGESEACDYYLVSATHDSGSKSESPSLRFKTTSSNYRISDLDKHGEYTITVEAVAGRKKAFSASETTSVDLDPLKRPVIKSASSPGAGRIDLKWKKIPNAEKYIIKEVSESDGDVKEITLPADKTSATFMGKVLGNSYKYTVTAKATIDGNEFESAASKSMSASPATPRVGQATSGEGGRLRGGKAGDQGGGECDTAKWSYSSKNGNFNNWKYVARFKDDEKAIKAAESMIAACENNNIGYDQSPSNGRGELKSLAGDAGWDMSAITTPCECSCSPLVGACIACTGIDFPAPGSTSDSDFLEPLKRTGEFDILTDSKYLTTNVYLQQGDILVSPDQHTCMVI